MCKIKSLLDIMLWIQDTSAYLNGKIDFDETGWPIFRQEHFLCEWPEYITTFQHRNNKKNNYPRDKTALCFYSPDDRIYPRFLKILEEIGEYKKYLGVVAPDITVTQDMDIELQETILLANQLFMAVLAVNGIKVVMNTRSGNTNSYKCFRYIPKGVMCSSGFLGCHSSRNYYESVEYINKVLYLRPSKLLIYGKKDKIVEDKLDLLGVNYRRMDDFRRNEIIRRECA